MSTQVGTSFTVSNLGVSLKGQYTSGPSLIPQTAQLPAALSAALKYAYGVNAGQLNQLAYSQGIIAASVGFTIVFSALFNPDGSAFNPKRIKFLLLYLAALNADGTAGATSVLVGNAALHPFQGPLDDATATIQVRNGPQGGLLALACGDATGWATVAATSDQLLITNQDAGHSATYTAVLGGCDT